MTVAAGGHEQEVAAASVLNHLDLQSRFARPDDPFLLPQRAVGVALTGGNGSAKTESTITPRRISQMVAPGRRRLPRANSYAFIDNRV